MLNKIFSSSPSKFGSGVPLLWKGIDLKKIRESLPDVFIKQEHLKDTSTMPELFLFESARSGIYNALASRGIGEGDEVIVCSFTCDALMYAVSRTSAKVVYVDINNDFTMNAKCVMSAVTLSTKAVIVQNTFGRLGLDLDTISVLKSKGIFILEDCALSIGSKINNIELGTIGDMSVFSLEVSKTITIGWGGVIRTNNISSSKSMQARYLKLGAVSNFSDFRRFFQLSLTIFLSKYTFPGSVFIWYFLYGTRIFRKSNYYKPKHPTKNEKLGKFSKKLFWSLYPSFEVSYKRTNNNFKELETYVKRLGLICPISEKNDEYIITPRISIMVDPSLVNEIVNFGKKNHIEVGRWFDDVPPSWNLSNSRIKSCDNARAISYSVINFPCHWTLTKKQLCSIKDMLCFISNLKSSSDSK